MFVLLTGAFGIVGRETIPVLLAAGHRVRAFDLETGKNHRLCAKIGRDLRRRGKQSRSGGSLEVQWGSLTDIRALSEACQDVDMVIHLGAVIPPAADRDPMNAFFVNVGASEMLVQTLERNNPRAGIVFSSSISVYGDRLRNPYIGLGDEVRPLEHDWYARQKVLAEGIIRSSSLSWVILRLTYIVSAQKLAMDPLMFAMPLDTSLEICHARDVAQALCHAATGLAQTDSALNHMTFHVAGGPECRTTFRGYLKDMFEIFGLGRRATLPEQMWSKNPYHCGFMDTEESQALLGFQNTSLSDYYSEVRRRYAMKRWFIRLVRPLAWRWILSRSPVGPEKSGISATALARLVAAMRSVASALDLRRARVPPEKTPGSLSARIAAGVFGFISGLKGV